MSASIAEFSFDPFAPGPHDQRPAFFAELRERAPICHTDADLWVVSRFDDVKSIQSMPQRFSSRPNPYEGAAARGSASQAHAETDPAVLERMLALLSVMPVDMAELASAQSIASADPPQHTRLRRIVSRGFTSARIARMSTTIKEIVDRCLAGVGDLDAFDVVERLAIPLPVEMISSILGLGDGHYADVKRWSDHLATAAVGDIRNTAEGQLALLNTLKEFSTFFVPLVDARRVDPRDDVISAMVRAVDDDTLSTVEALNMAVTIMVAGNETSTNLIGNTVVELFSNPDQLALLLADPSLLTSAVEEANRLTAPIQVTFRETIEDTEIAGTIIPKGAIVALHLAAANRDPRQFDDPDRFLINRSRTKSLAFGGGIHFCLGAHLAMQEVTAAIGGILPHLTRFRLGDGPLELNPSAVLNGWQRVELVGA